MGGFGAVYLAVDTKNSNRPVAIKDMICADPTEFAIRLNFFRREAEILRSLDAVPIVPRVYDLIEEGQSAHLVLEFIRGQDLLKIMEGANNKPFNLDQVIEWAKAICDVLTHMHTQSPPLVHRDLKPDNIMLLEDKKTIKMIDFGTARDLGRTQKENGGQDAGLHRRLRPAGADHRQAGAAQRPVRPGRHAVSPGDRQGAGRLLHRQGNRDAAERPTARCRRTSAGSTS